RISPGRALGFSNTATAEDAFRRPSRARLIFELATRGYHPWLLTAALPGLDGCVFALLPVCSTTGLNHGTFISLRHSRCPAAFRSAPGRRLRSSREGSASGIGGRAR